MDLISELPDGILALIFSRLTLRQVVQTSLVSHRWRRVCASTSELVFIYGSMYPTCKKGQKEARDKYVRGVNQFLKFHGGSTPIISFMVFFCLGNEYKDDIDEWIRFTVRMGVEQLTLILSVFNREAKHKYVLRRELLSQGTESKLKVLELRSCILEPNFFNQFSCLKTLSLAKLPLGLHEVQNIFYGCSKLECLRLDECILPLKLSIPCSLRYLIKLWISFCYGVEELELSAMNLLKFKYEGPFFDRFSFIGVPKLEKAYFEVHRGSDMKYIFSHAAKDLPELTRLHVHAKTDLMQCIPENITIFRKIQLLKLYLFEDEKFDILKMTFLLRAFPVLQKFILMMVNPVDFEHRGAEPKPEIYVHKHLHEVQIAGFRNTSDQVQFAIYLLKHAVALKQFVIDPRPHFRKGGIPHYWGWGRSWDEGEREKVYEQLQEFSKDGVLIIR